jgi:argininosuccinate lyase
LFSFEAGAVAPPLSLSPSLSSLSLPQTTSDCNRPSHKNPKPPPPKKQPPKSQGSQAYARALSVAGILTADEASTIVAGLDKVAAEWAAGAFLVKPGDEDIHTANERRLTELVGSVGGKLHTGRSRNDQVATDTRLWLAGAVKELRGCVQELLKVAAARAEAESDVLMPGFTHLQPAQPVRWGHWLLSHAAAWQRDDARLGDLLPRVATLPLGSGALAGNPFGVDRRAISRDLGFDGRVCPNSMDAVSDRDFVAEFCFATSLLLNHLSRFSEDLIIYSSGSFGFVACSDAYATGSSLMPQKKNPDALELMRGKAGVLAGNLAGVMSVIKGTPTTYNKDFQEAWPLMFGSFDTAHDCVRIATGVLSTLTIKPERMLQGLSPDMLATDLAGELLFFYLFLLVCLVHFCLVFFFFFVFVVLSFCCSPLSPAEANKQNKPYQNPKKQTHKQSTSSARASPSARPTTSPARR